MCGWKNARGMLVTATVLVCFVSLLVVLSIVDVEANEGGGEGDVRRVTLELADGDSFIAAMISKFQRAAGVVVKS